jgi:hypothetical protein
MVVAEGYAVGCGVAVGGRTVGDGAARVGRGFGVMVAVATAVFSGVSGGASASCGPVEKDATAERAMKKATAATMKTSRKAMRSGDMVTPLRERAVPGRWPRIAPYL